MATHESSSSAFRAGFTLLMVAKVVPMAPAELAAALAGACARASIGKLPLATETTNAPAALKKSRLEVPLTTSDLSCSMSMGWALS